MSSHFRALVQSIKDHPRPYTSAYFLLMAHIVSSRSTCARRRVGCVFVDADNHVLATGYNGVARGLPHCTDKPCPGAALPSGTGLSVCEALHAEENALIQLRDPNLLSTIYLTASPCVMCTRKLLNTRAERIVFDEEYPHTEARDLWMSTGRSWEQYRE